VRVVLAADLVFANQTAHNSRLEQPALRDPSGGEQVIHQRRKLPLQPLLHRDAEALLFPLQDAVGQDAAKRALEDEFALTVAHFEVARHRERQLHDADIQKRRARLERRGHAHAIDFRQDVVGQVDRHVRVQLPIQRVVVTAAERLPDR
jgi:hypothetical protein